MFSFVFCLPVKVVVTTKKKRRETGGKHLNVKKAADLRLVLMINE
jgi:hypothetical protein